VAGCGLAEPRGSRRLFAAGAAICSTIWRKSGSIPTTGFGRGAWCCDDAERRRSAKRVRAAVHESAIATANADASGGAYNARPAGNGRRADGLEQRTDRLEQHVGRSVAAAANATANGRAADVGSTHGRPANDAATQFAAADGA